MTSISRAALGIAGAALLVLLSGATASTQSPAAQETTHAVRRALERLPYYGVFDFIAFSVDRGTVTLVGHSYQGTLKKAATTAVKQTRGVDEVVDKIEELPVSQNDDRIRWATFYRIYTDDFLSRYSPGGAHGALRELREAIRFPGMQPVGVYPIHIIVRGGRTLLLGEVDNAADRQMAEVRAREVFGAFAVENALTLAPSTR